MSADITAEIAWKGRQRGMRLPVCPFYVDEKVAEIARRQKELMDEHDKLDKELQHLAEGE